MAYRLRTLGGVSLESDAGALSGTATQRRRLALLVVLASAGTRGVSRDRLVGLLWPESEPAKARQVLAQWLHLIRRDLGDDGIVVGTADLRLDPARLSSDVSELADALDSGDFSRAAALYAGPFLDGFYLTGAPEFERWVEEERTRLRSRMRAAYDALAREAAQARDVSAAVHWRERVAALDPLDARAALAYMTALADAGERAKAIQHARLHATLVRDQLETDPDPAIPELAERLRTASLPDGAPAATTGAARSVAAAGSASADGAPSAGVPAVSPPPAPPAAATAPGTHAAAMAARSSARRRLATQVASVAGLAAIMVAVVTAVPAERGTRAPRASRVMIAPFQNETGDSSLDPIGRMASDWIVRGVGETGLLEIAPGEPGAALGLAKDALARATAAGAGTLITGRFYRQGDSLAFQAQVLDVRGDRLLAAVGPVLAARDRPLDGVEVLRRRMSGSMAALANASFSPLGPANAVAPSREAFDELLLGHEAANRRRHREAIEHYRRAAALDTGYLNPIVNVARSYGNMFDCARVDSVARLLAPRRARLSAYEALQLDRELLFCAGDRHGAYRAAKAMYALAPNSGSTRMYLARNASALNRQREVLALLLPANEPLTRRLNPLRLSTLALHTLGDHQRELEVARWARQQYPDLVEPLELEGRALAALGDTAGARRDVDAAMAMGRSAASRPHEAMTSVGSLLLIENELRAHGFPAESRAMALALAAWLQAQRPAPGDSAAVRERLHGLWAAYVDAGEWDAARSVVDTLTRRFGGEIGTLAARGRLAAWRGDVREADRVSDALAGLTQPYLNGDNTFVRAQIAAVLGRKERAVALLRQAISEGLLFDSYWTSRVGSYNHAHPELQSLRGYAPFEELLKPTG